MSCGVNLGLVCDMWGPERRVRGKAGQSQRRVEGVIVILDGDFTMEILNAPHYFSYIHTLSQSTQTKFQIYPRL